MSYLGKISAIVSANTSDFSAKLAASGKEVQSWARSLNTAVNTASSKASSSLRGIYTEAQKAERALQAIQAQKINFKGFEGQNLATAVDRMRSLISVTKEINGPLNQAARALERMPAAMQGGFLQAMKTAQQRAELIAIDLDRIASGKSSLTQGGLEKKFEAIANRAMRTAEAVERLKTVASGVEGLATGREVQFRNPEFAAEMARARGIQAQAASTPGGNFAGIIERQRAAADATAVAFARMEEAQLTLGGDVAGTTAEYERQLTILREIGRELESSVAVTNARTAAEAKAVQAENQFYLRERDRRSGRLSRGNASAFNAATEELMSSPANANAPIFGAPAKSVDSEVQRTRDLYREFLQLSPQVRAALEGERQKLDNIAKAARDGAAGIGLLSDANDRMAASIDTAKAKMTQEEALEAARQNFSMTPEQLAATARERGVFQPLGDLQKSAADLRTMQDEMRKLKAASNFGTTLDEAFEASKISRAKAEIAALQSILIKIGATTGNAAEAVDDFAAGWQRATSEVGGTIKYAKQLKEIADDAAEAVQAAVNSSAAAGGPKIDVKKVLSNVGDVGRLGADKASLALQQLGFAVDDFMSSTGGIDQKIRAVSNNISQMAFIIGSTKGLFAALGVTMAAQAAVMVYKYVAGGKTAEDQTKALNDALAKQRSLLEDLKQAFESFANMLGRNIFSKSAGDARDYQKQIDEIVKKQKERRDTRLADLSPEVQKERSEQNRINRELEGTTDMGQRAALLAQRAASERREKAAAAAAAAAPAPGRAEIDRAMQATIRANEFLVGGRMTARSEQAAEERRQRAKADVAAADTAQKQADVVRARLAERQEMASRPITAMSVFGGEATEIVRAREDVAALEILLAQLEEKVRDGGNALAVSVLEGSVKVARSLEATQQLLDATLIPFSQTRAEADKAAAELTKIVDELKTAEDPARIAELQKQQAALEQQSAQYRSAAEVIRTFADTVKRISTDLVNAVESETRSIADKARRDANRAQAGAQVNGEFGPNGERRRPGDAQRDARDAQGDRREAEVEARRAQDEADRVRDENDRLRREFEAGIAADPQVQAEKKRLEELQAVIDNKDATEEEKARAAEEKRRILRRQERRFEDSPQGRAAAARADLADQRAAAAQEEVRQGDEKKRAGLSGRDLGLKPGVAEAREARSGLLDIGDAKDLGMLNAQQAQEQANRFAQEQMRSAAPAIFEMADAVANAVLQGPSRQALDVTDVSTMEGSRELNRLLRGDDASKNANIVELEKQNQKLTELVTTMKDVAQRMGVVLDL